jgi:hypothetical protein
MLGEGTVPPLRKAGVAADAIIFHGAAVGPDANGYMAPASTTLRPLGVADLEMFADQAASGQSVGATLLTPGYKVDNTGGADGARSIVVRCGVFAMKNKVGDEVTAALIGAPCYVEDDETVRATSTDSVVAGIVHGFTDAGLPLVLIQDNALA